MVPRYSMNMKLNTMVIAGAQILHIKLKYWIPNVCIILFWSICILSTLSLIPQKTHIREKHVMITREPSECSYGIIPIT